MHSRSSPCFSPISAPAFISLTHHHPQPPPSCASPLAPGPYPLPPNPPSLPHVKTHTDTRTHTHTHTSPNTTHSIHTHTQLPGLTAASSISFSILSSFHFNVKSSELPASNPKHSQRPLGSHICSSFYFKNVLLQQLYPHLWLRLRQDQS